MTDFPWDVAILLALGLTGVLYICVAILVDANNE